MNPPANLPIQALPNGEAELRLVVQLTWDDIAALGKQASRLAAQHKRPVSLDEAASDRLRTRLPDAGQGNAQRMAALPPRPAANTA
ncbi:hypothetical protein [Streptomyces sp.]|uniref:hypothetical protein n=1 Tax=Streptomyces sp. TaxID=1931 RepID=UPI002F932515